MDCTSARLLLQHRTVTGLDLDELEREELDAHLTACPLCRAQAADDARFDDHLGRAVRAVPVPAGLRERLLAAVAPARPARRWRKPLAWGAGAAAAACLALVACAWYFGRGPLRQPIAPNEVQMAYIAAAARDVDAVNDELRALGARRCAPTWANYNYLTGAPALAVLPGYRAEKVKVPQLVFTRGNQKALVYALSDKLYKVEDFEAHGPYEYNLHLEWSESGSYGYLILYTGRDWEWLKRPEPAH